MAIGCEHNAQVSLILNIMLNSRISKLISDGGCSTKRYMISVKWILSYSHRRSDLSKYKQITFPNSFTCLVLMINGLNLINLTPYPLYADTPHVELMIAVDLMQNKGTK